MIKTIVISIIASAAFIFMLPWVRGAYAATLQFEPTTVATTVGKTFEVKISINSGGEEINRVDAFVLYDASLLKIQAVKDGSFFPTVLNDPTKAGRAYIAGIVTGSVKQ